MSAPGYLLVSIPLRLASAGASVAIPILAVEEFNDLALGGGLVAASLAPAVIAAPLAGAVLDRSLHPKRWVLGAAVATVVGFAAAALLGTLPIPLIVVLLIAAGAAAPFYMGGLSSFVTDEIPEERKAYAYDALSYNVAGVAGPGLVAVIGIAGSFRGAAWVMVVAAALGGLAALALKITRREAVRQSVLRTMADGITHIVRHRPLALVTVAGTVNQTGVGALPIAALALSLDRAGSTDQAAVIVTAFAIGGLVGGLVTAAYPLQRIAPELVMSAGFAVIGILTIVSVLDFGLVWTIALIGLSGVLTAPSSAAMLFLRKEQSPLAVRSQVFTIGSGLRATSSALGAAVAGLLVGVDSHLLFVGIGVVWLLSAAIMVAYPRDTAPFPDVAPVPAR